MFNIKEIIINVAENFLIEERLGEGYDNVSIDYIKNQKKLDDYKNYKDKIVINNNTYLNFIENDEWFLWGQIKVFDNEDGTEIANSTYGKITQHSVMNPTVDVRSDKRRQGIASNMYRWIEELTGYELYPDTPHSKSAEALWGNPNRKFGANLNESFDNNAYNTWKRKNVTLRGIKNPGEENGVYGSYGKGLYTVPLGNKAMAKQYGEVYYLVNAIPKKPKIVNNLNDAEMLRRNLVNNFCIENGVKYNMRYFEDNTSMDKEMLKLGYDGLIIKGREMVNYTPTNVKYFKTENQLVNHYNFLNDYNDLNEATATADKAFYDIADDFYEKMIVELNNANYTHLKDNSILFEASNIDSAYDDLWISFINYNSNSNQMPFGNNTLKGGYAFGTTGRHKVIVIPNLKEDRDPTWISKDSFIHEFIHYLDYVRSKGKFKDFNQNTTVSDYYNSPSEYNAYYQEAANYLVNLLKDDAVLAKIKEKHPTFNTFYKWMLDNVFSKRFIANLNDKNKLKIEKRIYNIYSEYVENNSSNDLTEDIDNTIAQDINDNIWYHASPNNFNLFEITTDIGYHFGTKAQAIDRMKKKRINNYYIYKVKLNVKKPLITKDKNTWFGVNLLSILATNKLINRKASLNMLDELKRKYKYDDNGKIIPNWSEKALIEWNNVLKKILYSSDYDSIIYQNKYEDKNSNDNSVVVFNSNQIQILDTSNNSSLKTSNNSSLKTSNNLTEDIQLIRGVGNNNTGNVDLFGKGLYLTDDTDVANFYGSKIKKYNISGNIFDTTIDFNQNELISFFNMFDKIYKTNIGTSFYNELVEMNDGQQPYIDYIGISWALDSRPEFQNLLKQNNLITNNFNSYANICTAMNIVLKKMGYSGLKYSTTEIEDLDDKGLGNKNAYLIFNKASIKELI
jgi:hypothetical protein